MSFVATSGQVVGTGARAPGFRPTSITDYRGRVRSYAAIYRSQPNLRTVVSFLARHAANIRFKLYERTSATERDHRGDHPLDVLLRHPHPRMGRHRFYLTAVSDLGIFDNVTALKVRFGDELALQLFPPEWVTPKGDNPFDAERYEFRGPGATRPTVVDFEDVLHVFGYNPTERGWGLSPVETLRTILDEDLAASHYRAQMWRRGARMTGVIERPKDAGAWKDTARDRFTESWAANWTADNDTGEGAQAGGTPILEEGMTFRPLNFTAKEAEYLGARKLTRGEVRAAYHLSPDEDSTAAAATESRRNLYVDALGPLLDQLANALEVSLFPDFGLDHGAYYIEANLEEKLRGSFTERAEVISRAVGAPWLTRNEARAMDNKPAIDGGDELIVPLNVLVGGRASPADTAPGSPGAGQVGTAALASIPRAGEVIEAKAVELAAAYPAELEPWVAQHEDTLGAFVERQRRSVMSRLGAGQLPEDAFDLSRWDGELEADLAGLALAMAPDAAGPVADRFGIDYNLDAAEAWLTTNARIAAEGYNAVTLAAITAAYASPATLARDVLGKADVDEDDPPTPLELAADVFAWSATGRAAVYAVGRTTTVGSFVRNDAAAQAGAGRKRWVVTSSNPRASHATMDGEEVPFGEVFSNGLAWPGDPMGSAEDVAGCQCLVEFLT